MAPAGKNGTATRRIFGSFLTLLNLSLVSLSKGIRGVLAGAEEIERCDVNVPFSHPTLSPFPEVLVLGTGRTVLYPPASVRSHLNMMGIQVDVQSSYNAASTYNVLSEEGRKVAIAVIPSERLPLERRVSQLFCTSTQHCPHTFTHTFAAVTRPGGGSLGPRHRSSKPPTCSELCPWY